MSTTEAVKLYEVGKRGRPVRGIRSGDLNDPYGKTPWQRVVSFFRTVDRADLRSVSAKGVLAGVLVAILTYHLAMMPKRSGKDVGDSVNASIVLGLCAVLVVHSVLTVVRFG